LKLKKQWSYLDTMIRYRINQRITRQPRRRHCIRQKGKEMNARKIERLIRIAKRVQELREDGILSIDEGGVLMMPEVFKGVFTEFDVEDSPGSYYDTKITTIRDGVVFYSYANKEELK
jgi:hypothetical protein